MTWLQLVYVLFLYFGLCESTLRHINDGNESFIGATYRACKEEDEFLVIVFFAVCYVFWPITLTALCFFERRNRLDAVTRKLTS